MTSPLVSVIVPSYKRPEPLLELIGRLRQQRYSPFEVVIVEQSQDPELLQRLEALDDPRIRAVPRQQMNLPAARNEGVRAARGEVLLFIDDDDLPIGDEWIARHAANFSDPDCLGVAGRWCNGPEGDPSPRFPRLVERLAFTYTPLMEPISMAECDVRKVGVDFVLFTNGALRRSVFERVGGFDEGVPWGEEHSIFFKLAPHLRPGEHLVFDPTAAIWRRFIYHGGMNRRGVDDWHLRELKHRMIYYHGVVGHYFPVRFRALYPFYLARALQMVETYIWDSDNATRSTGDRLRAMAEVALRLPEYVYRYGWRLPSDAVVRVPEI